MSGKKDKLEDSLEALFAPFSGAEDGEGDFPPVVKDLEPLEEEQDASSAPQAQPEEGGEQAEKQAESSPPEPEQEEAPAPEMARVEQEEIEEVVPAPEPETASRPEPKPEPAPDPAPEQPESVSPSPAEEDQREAAPDEAPEAERAQRKSRRSKAFETGERVVVFSLEEESFGVDIYSIRTLVKPQDIFPVPHVADYLVGLTNLRGEIVPVVDLRIRLGLRVSEYTESTRFVVAEKLEEPICLIVDDVFGIEHFSPGHLEEPSDVISSVDTTYLHGIAKSEENLVLLLDLDQVLGEKILELTK